MSGCLQACIYRSHLYGSDQDLYSISVLGGMAARSNASTPLQILSSGACDGKSLIA
jgi:hypothetical protein